MSQEASQCCDARNKCPWLVVKGLFYQMKTGKGRVIRKRMHRMIKSFKVLAHRSIGLELFQNEKSGVPRD